MLSGGAKTPGFLENFARAQEALGHAVWVFDWDEDGALLLVDTHGMDCAVTVEYWSDDGRCAATAEK